MISPYFQNTLRIMIIYIIHLNAKAISEDSPTNHSDHGYKILSRPIIVLEAVFLLNSA